MAKKGRFEAVKVQKKSSAFAVGMAVYAAILLILTAIGWKVLWDFMGSYEQSRPRNTLISYMDSLHGDRLCYLAGELFAQMDPGIQSEEECKTIFLDKVDGKLRYVKDAENSSDSRQTYMLLADQQLVGSFVLESGEADRFGNRVWTVTESAYNFGFLLEEPVSVTVPEDCTVYANGKELDQSYITAENVPYELFGDFYADYDLPAMTTYTVESHIGDIALTARDASGEEIPLADVQSLEDRLDNCSGETKRRLGTFVDEFVARYVSFSGSSKDSADWRFAEFRRYLVPDSPLIQRFASAIDGLQFGQSVQDQIAQIDYHHVIQLDDNHWFVDVTYLVDTMGKKGLVQTTNNMKVIVTTLNDFYYVEGMTSY